MLIYLARSQETAERNGSLISEHISKRNIMKAKEHLGKDEEDQSGGGDVGGGALERSDGCLKRTKF